MGSAGGDAAVRVDRDWDDISGVWVVTHAMLMSAMA